MPGAEPAQSFIVGDIRRAGIRCPPPASVADRMSASPRTGLARWCTPLELRLGRSQVFGFHKRNSIWRFSDAAATRFLGRLGGPASSPISCCCNEMLSLDCRLEGAPSVPKSGEIWRFSRGIRASVHCSDLAVLGLELARHLSVVSLPPSSFGLHPSLERQSRRAGMEPAVCWMFSRYPDPSRSGGRGPLGPSAKHVAGVLVHFRETRSHAPAWECRL